MSLPAGGPGPVRRHAQAGRRARRWSPATSSSSAAVRAASTTSASTSASWAARTSWSTRPTPGPTCGPRPFPATAGRVLRRPALRRARRGRRLELPFALEVAAAWRLPALRWQARRDQMRAGVLVGLTIQYLPGRGGHSPADGLQTGGAPSAIQLPGIVLAGLASVAFGAVAGPEAPLLALGSGLGAPPSQ